MTPEQAHEWNQKNSKFVKLGDGESFEAVLKDMKPVPSKFDPEKETIHYTFVMDDGSVKYFDNASGGLCESLAGLVGKKVKLTRHGTDTQTKYEVEEA
jgi:hypothetical protein